MSLLLSHLKTIEVILAENKPKRRPRELAIAARGQARIEKKKVVLAISGPSK
jgi:hypothetical protein